MPKREESLDGKEMRVCGTEPTRRRACDARNNVVIGDTTEFLQKADGRDATWRTANCPELQKFKKYGKSYQ